MVNFDNLHAVALARLGARMATLRRGRIPEVKRALGYVFGWPELTLGE